MAQVYGSVAAPRAVRVYVPDGTDARDDGKNSTSLWIGGRASASGTCVKGRCATYVARLAMTEKEVWHKHHGSVRFCV